MVRVSFCVPLRARAELREITRSGPQQDRPVMISSVRPSLRYASAGSGLMLSNGSTTIDFRSAATSTVGTANRSTAVPSGSVRLTPSGVMSNAQARPTAMGKPSAVSRMTRVSTQEGRFRPGTAISAICQMTKATAA